MKLPSTWTAFGWYANIQILSPPSKCRANAEQLPTKSDVLTDCNAICQISYQIANILIFADLYFLNGINIG